MGEVHQWYSEKPGPLQKVIGGPWMWGGDTVTAQVTSDGCEWYIGRDWISGKEWWDGKAETLQDAGLGAGILYNGGGIILDDKGSGLTFCDVVWCGVVMLTRVSLVVCKIIRRDSDSTSKHGWWFEGDRWTVYKERLVGVRGFFSLLSLLVPLYSKAIDNFGTALILVMSWLLDPKFECLHCPTILWVLPISPTSNPAHYKSADSILITWNSHPDPAQWLMLKIDLVEWLQYLCRGLDFHEEDFDACSKEMEKMYSDKDRNFNRGMKSMTNFLKEAKQPVRVYSNWSKEIGDSQDGYHRMIRTFLELTGMDYDQDSSPRLSHWPQQLEI